MGAILLSAKTNANDPLVDKPDILPGAEMIGMVDAAREGIVSARRAAQGKVPVVPSPICLEAVQRIDALFDIERTISGQDIQTRRATRQTRSAPLLAGLHQWLGEQRAHRLDELLPWNWKPKPDAAIVQTA